MAAKSAPVANKSRKTPRRAAFHALFCSVIAVSSTQSALGSTLLAKTHMQKRAAHGDVVELRESPNAAQALATRLLHQLAQETPAQSAPAVFLPNKDRHLTGVAFRTENGMGNDLSLRENEEVGEGSKRRQPALGRLAAEELPRRNGIRRVRLARECRRRRRCRQPDRLSRCSSGGHQGAWLHWRGCRAPGGRRPARAFRLA